MSCIRDTVTGTSLHHNAGQSYGLVSQTSQIIQIEWLLCVQKIIIQGLQGPHNITFHTFTYVCPQKWLGAASAAGRDYTTTAIFTLQISWKYTPTRQPPHYSRSRGQKHQFSVSWVTLHGNFRKTQGTGQIHQSFGLRAGGWPIIVRGRRATSTKENQTQLQLQWFNASVQCGQHLSPCTMFSMRGTGHRSTAWNVTRDKWVDIGRLPTELHNSAKAVRDMSKKEPEPVWNVCPAVPLSESCAACRHRPDSLLHTSMVSM